MQNILNWSNFIQNADSRANFDIEPKLIMSRKTGACTLNIQPTNRPELLREDIGEYVAQLQLHMALQARNLVPTLSETTVIDSRQQMLQETQAIAEKLVSRQSL